MTLSSRDRMRLGLLKREKAKLAETGASVDAIKAIDAKIAAASNGNAVAEARATASASILGADFDRYSKHPAIAALTTRLAAAAAEAPAPIRTAHEKLRAGLEARQRAREAAHE